MRNDMRKVVNEPARGGVGYYRDLPNEYRKAKRFKLITLDDGTVDVEDNYSARVQPMRAKSVGWDGKDRNYTTRPILRFLRSRVGKNWNDVYSEICRVFSNGVRGNHCGYLSAGQLIERHVNTHTYVEDGEICFNTDWGTAGLRINDTVDELYVHPITGVLCVSNTRETWKAASRRRAAERRAEEAKTRVVINKTRQFQKIGDVWFRVELTDDIPSIAYAMMHPRDAVGYFEKSSRFYLNHLLVQRYGGVLWAVRKETASKADIRRHNLV
jgi:hypothetical protein